MTLSYFFDRGHFVASTSTYSKPLNLTHLSQLYPKRYDWYTDSDWLKDVLGIFSFSSLCNITKQESLKSGYNCIPNTSSKLMRNVSISSSRPRQIFLWFEMHFLQTPPLFYLCHNEGKNHFQEQDLFITPWKMRFFATYEV